MKYINLFFKRLFDILFSLLFLLIISPVLLIVSILIKLLMPGPIFFKQKRVGKNGEIFNILKFRSMKEDKKAEENFDSTHDEMRLTHFGKFIRRFKIDELPQLINVLTGDMSLVGPRPTIKKQTDLYNDFQNKRLKMRPGMTGLAQVNGNSAITWDERIKYDVYYIENFNILLDIKIIIKTIAVVFLGEEKFR